MLLSSIGISCGFSLIQAHGVVHLKDLGHSPAEAATAMSILAISTLIGKLLASFGDRIQPRYIWAFAMTAFGLGIVLVVHATARPSVSIPDPARIWMGRNTGIDDGCAHELFRIESLSGGDRTVARDSNHHRSARAFCGRLRVRQIRKLYAGVLFDRRFVLRRIAPFTAGNSAAAENSERSAVGPGRLAAGTSVRVMDQFKGGLASGRRGSVVQIRIRPRKRL